MTSKKIFFFQPYFQVVSEVWIERMLEIFADRLALIVGRGVPDQWNGTRCFDLDHPPYSILTRIKHRILGRAHRTKELRNTIAEYPGAIILVNYANFALELEPCWRGLEVTVLIHCHGFDVHFDGRGNEWPHSKLHDEFYIKRLISLPLNHHFVANSKFTRDSMVAHGMPAARIALKNYGVELPSCPDWDQRKKKQNLRLLYLGRLIDFKGPDKVIRGFEIACEQGFQGTLTMAGNGQLLAMCEMMAATSKYKEQIEFCGAVGRRGAQLLYADSDIFVGLHCLGELTNREEAFGVTMVEAMAHGLPVVTGRSGGIVESVVDGETGFLIEPGDINAFAEKLLALQNNPKLRIQMGQKGRERVESNFTLEHERLQWESIMQKFA
ncbi:glycosyltransferase involved in cell wall biosynthesis [Prosthecobacter fusiformis]|uniref:Glycosyltransferase involved in cell wall biosynthesis n=1 Tax=Prosthecobacter fusiformis TaxID=48464 RepID=A0A4R7S133_9BACT|nr:glycosyltransferase family 4 protein [Prosthecobacter fusiformis]TDU71389.1 glycosyltransferase involved in cell wall biosynthesis [Prosthecobacter fusiformis]